MKFYFEKESQRVFCLSCFFFNLYDCFLRTGKVKICFVLFCLFKENIERFRLKWPQCSTYVTFYVKIFVGPWRDGSTVKSTGCSEDPAEILNTHMAAHNSL